MPINILVTEDESIVRKDIERCLGNLGYNVIASADNGEDAISMAMKRIEIPSLSFSSNFVLLPALRTRLTVVIWSEFVCIVFDFKVKRELLT